MESSLKNGYNQGVCSSLTFNTSIAIVNPPSSSTPIPIRLGSLWRNLDQERKEVYFNLARKGEAEHKRKYQSYVFNPKKSCVRKVQRVGLTSWPEQHSRAETGYKQPNMTLSMGAEAGFGMMDPPAWNNHWLPYRHNSMPYSNHPHYPETMTGDPLGGFQNIHQQRGGSGDSAMSSGSSACSVKGPLTQLQELTNVLKSPDEPYCQEKECGARTPDSQVPGGGRSGSSGAGGKCLEGGDSTSLSHDSDSGYVTDHHVVSSGCSQVARDCDTKAGLTDILNEQPTTGTAEDNPTAFLEPLYSGDYPGLEEVLSEGYGKTTLPGFQQAFGSTEIGRFSRNDFFTHAPQEVYDIGSMTQENMNTTLTIPTTSSFLPPSPSNNSVLSSTAKSLNVQSTQGPPQHQKRGAHDTLNSNLPTTYPTFEEVLKAYQNDDSLQC